MKLQDKKTVRAPISDGEIIELYWQRDERAIEETDLKYRNFLYTVAYNIVRDTLDCEECLNDTYIGAWNSMPPSRPDVLKAFLTVIMRRTAVSRYRQNNKKSAVSSEMTVSLDELDGLTLTESSAEGCDTEQLGSIISDFLLKLDARKRYIFMNRYYLAEPIDKIASEIGVSRSTVNKELAAIRESLRKRIESEGYTV